MNRRASVGNLWASLGAFAVFVLVLLAAMGFGVGTLELLIWLALLVVGVGLIVRRYQRARQESISA